jgi:hypothetical protein
MPEDKTFQRVEGLKFSTVNILFKDVLCEAKYLIGFVIKNTNNSEIIIEARKWTKASKKQTPFKA